MAERWVVVDVWVGVSTVRIPISQQNGQLQGVHAAPQIITSFLELYVQSLLACHLSSG